MGFFEILCLCELPKNPTTSNQHPKINCQHNTSSANKRHDKRQKSDYSRYGEWGTSSFDLQNNVNKNFRHVPTLWKINNNLNEESITFREKIKAFQYQNKNNNIFLISKAVLFGGLSQKFQMKIDENSQHSRQAECKCSIQDGIYSIILWHPAR